MRETNKEMVFNNETVDMKALGELLQTISDLRLQGEGWISEQLKEFEEKYEQEAKNRIKE